MHLKQKMVSSALNCKQSYKLKANLKMCLSELTMNLRIVLYSKM